MSVYEMLRASAVGRKPCKISKAGEPERKVCPYLLGNAKDGEVNVLYYQYEGYSSRGLREDGSSANWRCNRVNDIVSAVVIDEPWREPNQKPKARGTCVVTIAAEVEGYY